MPHLDDHPPLPLLADAASLWMLRPGVAYLNHGSFGAVPREVAARQEEWRRRIEAEPVEMLWRRFSDNLSEAKRPIGDFLKMSPDDFGLVTNATEGVAAILHSLDFAPGDELLTTNHVYNAVRQAMRHTAARHNATCREIEIRTPLASADDIYRRVIDGLGDRTRLLVIDHVTSPTALVFPVQRIAAACAARGIDVLVDGAHAPGMLDLDIPSLGVPFYTGNLHKWVCAPRGCAILWVQRQRQARVHPAAISHHLSEGFTREFEWQGTRDFSAWLAAPAAVAFMHRLDEQRVRAHNHHLACWAHRSLSAAWHVEPISPADGSLLGAMATIRLPGELTNMTFEQARALQQSLYAQDQVEVPLVPWQGGWYLRISAQLYNTPQDYDRLERAILKRVM